MSDYMKVTDGVNVVEIVGDKIVSDIDGKTEVFDRSVDISEVFRYINLVKSANHFNKSLKRG